MSKVPEGFKLWKFEAGIYELSKHKLVYAVITRKGKRHWEWRLVRVPGVRNDGSIYSGRVAGSAYSLQYAIDHLTQRVLND